MGVTLTYTKPANVAYGVAGVTAVNNVQLNGGTADLVVMQKKTAKAGTITVT
jgi:hypothetical protein